MTDINDMVQAASDEYSASIDAVAAALSCDRDKAAIIVALIAQQGWVLERVPD